MSGRLGDDQPNEEVPVPVIPVAPNTGPAPPAPQQRVAEAETETVWRMDASVNLPQQAAPSPHELAARLAATAAVRSQAFRFCAAEEVAGDIKSEFARYLAAVQTPEAILACAGESIPALKNYIFQVLKSGAAPPEGEATPQTVLESMRAFDLYWLRCTADPETGSTAPRMLRLKQSLREGGVPCLWAYATESTQSSLRLCLRAQGRAGSPHADVWSVRKREHDRFVGAPSAFPNVAIISCCCRRQTRR